MALGQHTQEMLALKLPHLAPHAEQLEDILARSKLHNQGFGHVDFDMQGLDEQGNIVIKYFDLVCRLFTGKKWTRQTR